MSLRLALRATCCCLLFAALSACVEDPAAPKDPDAALIHQEVEGWELLRLAQPVESPHPYPNLSTDETTFTVRAPTGALELRVLFDHLQVERDYDAVRIFDGKGALIQQLTGTSRGWSDPIPGDTATLTIVSDDTGRGFGFRVPAVQFRRPDLDGDWQTLTHDLSDTATPHPYADNTRQKWTLTGPPDALAVRARFQDLSLERGYDFIHLYDAHGVQAASYTGDRGPFTTVAVPGNTLTIELITDSSINAYGFELAALEVLPATPAGCAADADCGDGQICQVVQCIRAPCPAQCVPADPAPEGCLSAADCPEGHFCESLRCLDPPCGGRCLPTGPYDHRGPAERCDDARPCDEALTCTPNLASDDPAGICALAAWTPHFPLRAPLASAHPYADNLDRWFDVSLPAWVHRFALHLDGVALEDGYDHLSLYPGADRDAQPLQTFTGAQGDLLTDLVDGHTAALRLQSDYSVTDYGFEAHTADVYGLPEALVAVSYEPQQCPPPHEDNPRNGQELRHLMQARGWTLYGLKSWRANDPTCRACVCPNGQRFVMALRPDDAAAFLANAPLRHKALWRDEPYQPHLPVTALRYAPRQCGNNPWTRWAEEVGIQALEEPALIQEFLAANFGVTPLFTWQEALPGFVCQACSCPRGDLIHAVVEASPDQLQALQAAGWAP
jgi:hypothetical protein